MATWTKGIENDVMLELPTRTKYMKDFLGDPVHLILFTLFNGIIVTVLRDYFLFQIVGIAIVAVLFFVLAGFYGGRKIREALFRALPGQIRYHRTIKRLEINQRGKGKLKIEYDGDNLGKTPIRSLYHDLHYDRDKPLPKKIQGKIGDDPVKLSTSSYEKRGNSKVIGYYTKIFFDFPEPVEEGSPIPIHSFTADGIDYSKALKEGDMTGLRCDVLADNLTLEIIVPKGFRLVDQREEVLDFHERADPSELERIRKKCLAKTYDKGTRVKWKIKNPKLTYRYNLYFRIEKL